MTPILPPPVDIGGNDAFGTVKSAHRQIFADRQDLLTERFGDRIDEPASVAFISAARSAGLLLAAVSATLCTKAWKSAFFATKSVSS